MGYFPEDIVKYYDVMVTEVGERVETESYELPSWLGYSEIRWPQQLSRFRANNRQQLWK